MYNEIIEPTIDQLQSGSYIFGVDNENTNNYIVNIPNFYLNNYIEGMVLNLKFKNANTSSVTLKLNDFNSVSILKDNENQLDPNDIKSEQIISVVYNKDYLQLLNTTNSKFANNVSSLDGSSSVGSSTNISRGDHKHDDSARHTHNNKNILDLTQEVFTKDLKSNYDNIINLENIINKLNIEIGSNVKKLNNELETIKLSLPVYYYIDSLEESSTTSSYPNYINKLVYNLTPISGTYILDWTCSVTNSNSGGINDTYIKLRNNNIILEEIRVHTDISYDNSGWKTIRGFSKLDLSDKPTNFYMDFCKQSQTAYIKNVKLLLRKID
jgi:hypothetical protein